MMRSRWHLGVPLLLLTLVLSACGFTAEESTSSGGVAGACLEGATECDDMGGDMGAPAPDEPVSDEPGMGDGGDAGDAERVEPQDGLVDLRPVGWDEVQVDPDDQSRVTVYWMSGVQECNALAEVEVEYGDAITLTVIEGTPPSDEPMACIELAVRKQTTVKLEEEVGPRSILDGADA